MLRENKEGLAEPNLRLSSGGYPRIHQPDHPRADRYGRVFEHIVVWEDNNKACLCVWGRIHHKNHVKTDNRPENLEAMTQKHHQRLHHLGVKRKAETGQKIRAKKLGIPQTPESNKKRSEALKGRTFSVEHRQKIAQANRRRKKPLRDGHGRYIRF